jgi:uncharacterized sulfatase
MQSRRQFLKASACAAAVGTALFSNCGEKSRPNILWLISEDTSPDFACYGNTLVKTPHVDKLAQDGIRFDNAFATCPVCSPTRSAFMTGMYQTYIGAQQHRTFETKPLPDPVKVITHYFREAGYFVSNGRDLQADKPGKTDWNFDPGEDAFDGTDWTQRAEDQPFFHQINFQMTHRTFQRDPDNPINPDDVEVPPYYPDHRITRRDWADYLESLQVLDKKIGTVLQRLEDEGLADNTIVFYFGDHGRPHVRAKQWLYEGGIRVPLLIRFPDKRKAGSVYERLVSLIDLAPTSMKLAGISPPAHLHGRDVLSRWSRQRKEIYAARDRCDGTEDRIRCVRTDQFKLIRNYFPDRPYTQFNGYKKQQYPVFTLMKIKHDKGELAPAVARFWAPSRPEYELYDLQNDPHEINNLAGNPDFAEVKNELMDKLENWIKEYDTGSYPEDAERVAYQQEFMQQRHIERMALRGLDTEISDEAYMAWWEEQLFGPVQPAN